MRSISLAASLPRTESPETGPQALANRGDTPAEVASSVGRWPGPHSIECDIRYCLESAPGVKVKSLVVRSTPTGVWLEGRVEVDRPEISIPDLLKALPELGPINNRLIACVVGPAGNAVDSMDSSVR
jgi:hypothetical protein